MSRMQNAESDLAEARLVLCDLKLLRIHLCEMGWNSVNQQQKKAPQQRGLFVCCVEERRA